MANTDIREAAKLAGVKMWQIADAMGFSEATLTRLLRKDLPCEKKKNILAAIERLKDGAAS